MEIKSQEKQEGFVFGKLGMELEAGKWENGGCFYDEPYSIIWHVNLCTYMIDKNRSQFLKNTQIF